MFAVITYVNAGTIVECLTIFVFCFNFFLRKISQFDEIAFHSLSALMPFWNVFHIFFRAIAMDTSLVLRGPKAEL